MSKLPSLIFSFFLFSFLFFLSFSFFSPAFFFLSPPYSFRPLIPSVFLTSSPPSPRCRDLPAGFRRRPRQGPHRCELPQPPALSTTLPATSSAATCAMPQARALDPRPCPSSGVGARRRRRRGRLAQAVAVKGADEAGLALHCRR